MKPIWILFILLLPSGLLPPTDASAGEGKFRAAVAACREQLGLPAPTPGQRPQLTNDQRSQLKACLAQAGVKWHHHHHNALARNPDFRIRMEACFAQDGVTFTPGQKPSDEQRAEFKKCRAEIKAAN